MSRAEISCPVILRDERWSWHGRAPLQKEPWSLSEELVSVVVDNGRAIQVPYYRSSRASRITDVTSEKVLCDGPILSQSEV